MKKSPYTIIQYNTPYPLFRMKWYQLYFLTSNVSLRNVVFWMKILLPTKILFYLLVYLQVIVTIWCIVNKRTSCKVVGEYCKEQFPLLMIYIVWPFVLLHIHYDMIFSPERLWCMRKWSNRCTCNYFAGINKSTKFGFKFNNWNPL